jgi:hypothetical protein
MRERASLLGGYMVVCSETGKGTSVRFRVPELQSVLSAFYGYFSVGKVGLAGI